MSKYDFILYAGQSDDFIERLRELGLVDVTRLHRPGPGVYTWWRRR